MKPTPAMIGAAHDVTMKEAGIILSHELIAKIYEAMQAQAAQSDDWARALRLADEAAESVICTEGEIRRPGVWRITREVLDADRAYLSDCLQHLAWRQMADVAEDHNTGDVIVTFRGEHPADSEATPALSTEQWRSD